MTDTIKWLKSHLSITVPYKTFSRELKTQVETGAERESKRQLSVHSVVRVPLAARPPAAVMVNFEPQTSNTQLQYVFNRIAQW